MYDCLILSFPDLRVSFNYVRIPQLWGGSQFLTVCIKVEIVGRVCSDSFIVGRQQGFLDKTSYFA